MWKDLDYSLHEQQKKLSLRVSELCDKLKLNEAEYREAQSILEIPYNSRVNYSKRYLLKSHFKSKLIEETKEINKHIDKYYFWDLFEILLHEANDYRNPSKKEINKLITLFKYDPYIRTWKINQHNLALKFQKLLDLDNQIKLCENWFSKPKKRKTAIMLIFRNYDSIIKESNKLKEQIRLYSGNHMYKYQYNMTNLICYQLIYNFQFISLSYNITLMESLVKGMNKNTQKSARKLFSRKFNLLPVNLRNSILKHIIENKKLPNYYLNAFLNEKYLEVSDSNKSLLKRKIKTIN